MPALGQAQPSASPGVTCLNETTGPCIEANPKEDIVNAILKWESSFEARTAPEPQFERADKWLSHGGVASDKIV